MFRRILIFLGAIATGMLFFGFGGPIYVVIVFRWFEALFKRL